MDDAVARGADIRSSLGQRGTPKNGKLGLDQQTWIRAEDWPRCVHTSAGRWPPFRIPCRGENKLPLLTIFLSKSDLCVLHSAHQREITVRIAPGNSNSSWGHADKRCYYIGIHKGLGSIGINETCMSFIQDTLHMRRRPVPDGLASATGNLNPTLSRTRGYLDAGSRPVNDERVS